MADNHELSAVDAAVASESPGPGAAQPETAGSSGRTLYRLLERFGLVIMLVVAAVVFSILLPTTFPTSANLRNVIDSQSVLAIVSLAALIPLTAGNFDLSLGAVLGITHIASAAALSRFGAPLWLAILIGPALGAAIGVVNGLIISKLGVNALISTLGVGTALNGVILWYTEGMSILSGIPDTLTQLGSGVWVGVPRTLVFVAIVALFIWYLIEHTPYGRYLHSVGSNPIAAHLVGLNINKIVIQSFVISGAVVGLGGVLLLARLGSGNPQVGIGPSFLLPALSAAFLGATSIHPGRFNVPGTVVALLFLSISVSGLALLGVQSWVEYVFNGAALVVAVSLSTLGRRRAGN